MSQTKIEASRSPNSVNTPNSTRFDVPSLKLTVRPWKDGIPKGNLIFQPSIWRCKLAVSFRDCTSIAFFCFFNNFRIPQPTTRNPPMFWRFSDVSYYQVILTMHFSWAEFRAPLSSANRGDLLPCRFFYWMAFQNLRKSSPKNFSKQKKILN